MLYTALTSIAMILGIAKRATRVEILSVPSGFVCCVCVIYYSSFLSFIVRFHDLIQEFRMIIGVFKANVKLNMHNK